jgi:Ni2+-binding GTPase involved in maturation of urease and hydrogenase
VPPIKEGSKVPSAVLITGVFGSGKTSTIEEIAAMLAAAGVPYGVIDLDWLCWFEAPGMDHVPWIGVLGDNLSAIVARTSRRGWAVRLRLRC